MIHQQFAGAFGFTVGYSDGPTMAPVTVSSRFILRVLDLIDQRGLNQKDLKGTFGEGWISNKMRGARKISLNQAADIAQALDYPLSELVRLPDDRTYELDNLEARLVEAFRLLSKAEQQAAVTLATLRQRPAQFAGKKVAKGGYRSATRAAAHGSSSATRPPSTGLSPNEQRHVAALAQASDEEDAKDARRQAPVTRAAGTTKTEGDRGTRKPDARKG